MNINQTHSYNHNLEEVFALFANPGFMEQKYSALGARNFKAKSVKLENTELLVDTRREVPVSEDTPSVIKRFVGEWNRTRQKEQWQKQNDGWHCQFKVDISGVPARIQGTMHLRPTENGCENEVSINVSSSIPLIGETLSRFIGENIDDLAQKEYKVILKHLESVTA
ncbi:DUF2505 domain-containing protein [Endozoicomonas sp. Mp262]|uniref:DUF2505 domain-containing protein n=1 Tax=Endozoicomonas sp. Mp262 TaxID=2919499 RepID=UPI0021D86ACF